MQELCTLEDLDQNNAFGGEMGAKRYFAVFYQGEVYAYENCCPHQYIPLEWQPHRFVDHDSGLIQCSSHGALFIPDSGLCVSGPCAGASLRQVSVEILGGRVFLHDHAEDS